MSKVNKDNNIIEIKVGYVVKVIYDSMDQGWVVQYKLDQDSQYGEKDQRATPLFNHTKDLFEGDQILVIKLGEKSESYYIPITLYSFAGISNGDNTIDITDKQRMFIKSALSIKLTVGSSYILITPSGININGNVNIVGDLTCNNNSVLTKMDSVRSSFI